MHTQKFYSNGKLLITGEYLVLDGAKSLALPTKQGQYLSISIKEEVIGILHWQSFDVHNNLWFSCSFSLSDFKIITSSNKNISKTLYNIFLEIQKMNSDFLRNKNQVINVTTNLTFETNWGLGSSSTLINNIASWAKVNPFDLQFKIFGGSAYDIACAQHDKPIVYQLLNNKPIIEESVFNPLFKDRLFFVHLNKKQNSRDAILRYKKNKENKKNAITEVTEITKKLVMTNSLIEFDSLLKEHEEIIATIIGMKSIQQRMFSDYFGQIKSLGAWGGDFILATGDSNTFSYFKEKGFETILPYKDIIAF